MSKKKENNFIDTFYSKSTNIPKKSDDNYQVRKSPDAKYTILDEEGFERGRKILGALIVKGMLTTGGTDLDWLIEHKGGFIIFEFKAFHEDKISIRLGQMIAYENLHAKLNQSTRCYLYFVGCEDIDFTNLDDPVWIFEMRQWKSDEALHKMRDIYKDDAKKTTDRYIIYKDFMEEKKVEDLQKIIDSHWIEFERKS